MFSKNWFHFGFLKSCHALLSILVLTSLAFSYESYIWERIGRGIYEPDIRTMFIDRKNNNTIYVGTSKALYRSTDGGKNYYILFRPSGKLSGVNDIFIGDDQPETVYVATDSGLYESQNTGKTWNRIYYASDDNLQRCYAVIRHNEMIYLGTHKGMFEKKIEEVSWRKRNGKLNNHPIYHLVENNRYLYGSTGQTVYSLDKRSSKIQKVFSIGIGEGRSENNSTDSDVEISGDQLIKYLNVLPEPHQGLMIATTKGIYINSGDNRDWRKLPINNLAVQWLTSVEIINNNTHNNESCGKSPINCVNVLASTDKGVFILNHERWIPLYKGMETNNVSYLTNDERGNVYAATNRGIYFLSNEKTLPMNFKLNKDHSRASSKTQTDPRGQFGFDHEPSINEVHQWAIDYAEVNSDKISNWRVLARRKALLPDLSVGLDRDASDLFHWNTGASPDELQKGREIIDWDVSLSWDLADMVWSTDQTTIDSRSKLMVELREDILDEVTRLYFERRRVQIELNTYDSLDDQLEIDKRMRVAELTALIDALTGGQFSKKIINQ